MSTSRWRTRVAVAATGAALAAPLALAGVANAAGFGQPIVVSADDDASTPAIAIAPNGRTAVVYAREIRRGGRYMSEPRVVLGDSPQSLGAPQSLDLPGSTDDGRVPSILARPGGGFVACSSGLSGPGRTTRSGCVFAPPGGSFGALKSYATSSGPGGRISGARAVVAPDGRVAVVISTANETTDGRITDERSVLTWLDDTGNPTTTVPIDVPTDAALDTGPVFASDGTAAITVRLPEPGKNGSRVGVQLLAPGATRFSAPVALSDEPLDGFVQLTGGDRFVVAYTTSTEAAEPSKQRFVVVEPGGALGKPASLTAARDDEFTWTLLPRGTDGFLGIAARQTYYAGDSDCYNPRTGVVRALPLASGGAIASAPQRLSSKGQIARWPTGAALANGTAIAVWENAGGWDGRTRLEVRLRESGASTFGPGQVLPRMAVDGGSSQLAASADAAGLVWTAAGRRGGSIVLSALRTAPPYAAQAPRPRHPDPPCDD